MEGREERTKEMKPLQKLAIPLALSLAGLIISTITRSHSSEQHQMSSPDNFSHDEREDEETFSSPDSTNLDQDVEVEAEASTKLQTSAAPETIQVQCPESNREILITAFNDGFNVEEEIDGIKSLAVVLQEREYELESQFYDYCNAKEQESAYQKLQIMCLGLKLESLESQNQSLEANVAECREAMQQMSLMREEIKLLTRKVKKLSKRNRSYMSILRQKEAKVLEANGEFMRATKDIQVLAEEMHKERQLISEKLQPRASADPSTSKVHTTDDVEGTMMERPNSKLLAELEQIRDQWSADIEEFIYLGWINASLRHEVLRNQEVEAKPAREVKSDLVVELPVDAKVRNCSIEFYDSDGPSTFEDHVGEACADVAAGKHHAGLAKPRLLHKLKGWAKGKGSCRRKKEGETSLERCSTSSRDIEDCVPRNSCSLKGNLQDCLKRY